MRSKRAVAGAALGIALVALLLALAVGGISYRKYCVTRQGKVSHEWTFQWSPPIPYVFRPSKPDCVVHTGTRVALNELGLLPYSEDVGSILAKSGAATEGEVAYLEAVYFVVRDVVNQVKAGGLLRTSPPFMRHERQVLEASPSATDVAQARPALLKPFGELEAELAAARAASAAGNKAQAEAIGRKAQTTIAALVHADEELPSAIIASHR
jgi:hypothetical protein